jgi:hypothetical protein
MYTIRSTSIGNFFIQIKNATPTHQQQQSLLSSLLYYFQQQHPITMFQAAAYVDSILELTHVRINQYDLYSQALNH